LFVLAVIHSLPRCSEMRNISEQRSALANMHSFSCSGFTVTFSYVVASNADLVRLMSDEKLGKPELLDQCVAYSQPEVVVRRLARDLIRLLLVRSAFDLTVYVRGFPRRSIDDNWRQPALRLLSRFNGS